jgi:deazaflavin-dependent oxidoreductase (nitroreductase family)
MQELHTDSAPATADQIQRSLSRGHTIDITTTGRHSGEPRRIEIVFHNIDGRIIITGSPRPDRRRAWLYNLEADPNMTFHLKGAVHADLPATSREITDPADRQAIADWVATNAWRNQDPAAMAAWSPMIEVTFPDLG